MGGVPKDCGGAGDLPDTHGSPANVHHDDGGDEDEEVGHIDWEVVGGHGAYLEVGRSGDDRPCDHDHVADRTRVGDRIEDIVRYSADDILGRRSRRGRVDGGARCGSSSSLFSNGTAVDLC